MGSWNAITGNSLFFTNYELDGSVTHTKDLSICCCGFEPVLQMIPGALKGKDSEALGENGVRRKDRISVDVEYLRNSVECECGQRQFFEVIP